MTKSSQLDNLRACSVSSAGHTLYLIRGLRLGQPLRVPDVVRSLVDQHCDICLVVIVVVKALAVQHRLPIGIAESEVPQRLVVGRKGTQPASGRGGGGRPFARADEYQCLRSAQGGRTKPSQPRPGRRRPPSAPGRRRAYGARRRICGRLPLQQWSSTPPKLRPERIVARAGTPRQQMRPHTSLSLASDIYLTLITFPGGLSATILRVSELLRSP